MAKKKEVQSEETSDVEYTKPTSQQDLERRMEEGYVPDSKVESTGINPNPFGVEDYAGTDPIYQNHANDTEAPHAAEEGADKLAEEHVRDLHEGEDQVDDPGLGGKSTVAASPNVERESFLVPGQEGYPDNPEKFSGPAVPKSAVEGNNSDDDDESDYSEGGDDPDGYRAGDANPGDGSTPVPPPSGPNPS